jgi:hypothetical protein
MKKYSNTLLIVVIALTGCETHFFRRENVQHLAETPPAPAGTFSGVPAITATVPAPTQGPVSTLDPAQVDQEILNLFYDNGGCALPCFFGVVPGKTSLSEVAVRFSLLGKVSGEDYRWTGKHKLTAIAVHPPSGINLYNETEWNFYVITENQIVESIVANSRQMEQTSNPSLSSALSIFGKPEEIWIAVMPHIPQYNVDTAYEIVLLYPSKGVLARWSGEAEILAETDGSVQVSICPQRLAQAVDMDEHYPYSLQLWSPETTKSFVDLSYEDKLFDHRFFSPLEGLQDGVTIEEFHETYLDPAAAECLELTQ